MFVSILGALLLTLAPLRSAAQTRADIAVALEGYPNEKVRQEWEDALSFRLRLNTGATAFSGRGVVALSSRQGQAALIREAARRGCQTLFVWNQGAKRADLYTLPGGQVRAISLAPDISELHALETIARSIEGRRTEETILLDIVFIIETGGRMYRLLPDAANFVAEFARTIQTATPVPDARFGLLTVTSTGQISSRNLTNSASAFADEIRSIRPAAAPPRLSLDQALLRLTDSYSWRAGSRRYAIVYLSSQLDAVPQGIDRLKMPGIRLITIPADGAGTKTHEVMQAMARVNGGARILPDYLVRYSDAGQARRAFYLFERTLYPLAHDVQEQNWYDIYESFDERAGDARRFRAGTIDESFEILQRSGIEGIRILEIKSTLARKAAQAIARDRTGLQEKSAGLSFAAPDVLLRLEHNRRTYVLPAVRSSFARLSREGAGWLGFTPIFEPTREDGFFPHPGTLLLLPASFVPPQSLQRNWRAIAAWDTGRNQQGGEYARRGTLFEPGRVFVRVENVLLTPMTKKRFILM